MPTPESLPKQTLALTPDEVRHGPPQRLYFVTHLSGCQTPDPGRAVPLELGAAAKEYTSEGAGRFQTLQDMDSWTRVSLQAMEGAVGLVIYREWERLGRLIGA